MKTKVLTVLIFTLLFTLPASAGVKVVANANNAAAPDSMSKAQVEDIFLKKTTRWENGQAVVPIDLAAGNRARDEFSNDFLNRDVTAVKSYWQKQIFSGRATAPVELGSEAEVLEFVRKFPAAIAYVSDGASIPEGVKVIKVD